MTYTQYVLALPPTARLALALVVSVGISLLMVRLFHLRVMTLDLVRRDDDERSDAGSDTASDDDVWKRRAEGDLPPVDTTWLAGVVRGLCGTAFVFLLAFTLSNVWGHGNDARTAVQQENSDLIKATLLAQSVPADSGRDELLAGLAAYRRTVTEEQWPLLQSADKDSAFASQGKAVIALSQAWTTAASNGASKSDNWSSLVGAIEDMTQQGSTRIQQAPAPELPYLIGVIALLGLSNVVLTAIFQPARLGPSLLLIGLMATVTTFMLFLLIEAANPYLGGAAISPPPLLVQLP